MRQEVSWWLRAGDRDLLMAEGLFQAKLYEGAAFHCQQAAEKFLKAIFLARRRSWLPTHSCLQLLRELEAAGIAAPEGLFTAARRLDLHYLESRYPNRVGGAPEDFYDAPIAQEALDAARQVRDFVQAGLGP